MTFMGTLLSGSAPLRGRAGLELVVPTLDYQLAAQFWNLSDPALAVKWNEVMGVQHLDRLRHIRGLLTAQHRNGAATARLLCFSGAGFTADLTREASQAGDVRLLSPSDLYAGVQ
jgi:hypothetical protein